MSFEFSASFISRRISYLHFTSRACITAGSQQYRLIVATNKSGSFYLSLSNFQFKRLRKCAQVFLVYFVWIQNQVDIQVNSIKFRVKKNPVVLQAQSIAVYHVIYCYALCLLGSISAKLTMPYCLDPSILKALFILVFKKHRGNWKRSNCEIQNPKIGLCDTCESNSLDCVNMTKAIIIKKR